jgi:hypothetical protein
VNISPKRSLGTQDESTIMRVGVDLNKTPALSIADDLRDIIAIELGDRQRISQGARITGKGSQGGGSPKVHSNNKEQTTDNIDFPTKGGRNEVRPRAQANELVTMIQHTEGRP